MGQGASDGSDPKTTNKDTFMSLNYFSAERILSPQGQWLKQTVLAFDEEGQLVDIISSEDVDPVNVRFYSGALIPGFVNAHCHLELSHMKSLLPTGTGLIPFIKGVVTRREAQEEIIQDAIQMAESEMIQNGIQAVGDISNVTDTFVQKAKGNLRYHTFVEAFDFMQEHTSEETFEKALQVYDDLFLPKGHKKSITPHAPYSVSPGLLQKIASFNESHSSVSIHNQETWHEQALFLQKGGDLLPFFESFGLDFSHFEATERNSIHHIIDHFYHGGKVLFVHNTLSTKEDISAAEQWNEDIYWVSCPNANLYIENQLPKYDVFLESGAKLALGTDSLASNWQLSIFGEMKTIKKYQSSVPSLQLIEWGTRNGAEALGFEDELGSLEIGKRPGLIHLDLMEHHNYEIQQDTLMTRLL